MKQTGEEAAVNHDQESIGARTLTQTLLELDNFLDIPLTISVELGRATQTVKEVLAMQAGTVVELKKLVGEPMEIYINGLLTARGEVVVVNERFGIRVTDVIDPLEIIRFSL
ncbi:MAG: flagellar motor switch protein FliN [Nitrospinae bacterium]|nr:flagellar motor switch protein FliN [Nitrospinota bacterium]